MEVTLRARCSRRPASTLRWRSGSKSLTPRNSSSASRPNSNSSRPDRLRAGARGSSLRDGSRHSPRLVAARDAVFPLPAGEGQGEGEGGLQLPGTRRLAWRGALFSFAQGSRPPRQFASALVCGAFLPPHPSPLPEERENRTPRRRKPTLQLTEGASLLPSRLP